MPRIAFIFPGQAAQRPGMASAWADTDQAEVFDMVGQRLGIDLAAAADDDARCAASTALAQPAIHAASLASFDALATAGVTPDVVAGHSLGEVTAAVAAEVFDRGDSADLVIARGDAMGQACAATPGAMAAIVRLELAAVEALLADVPDVAIANANAPGQVVISGPPAAVDEVIALAKEHGGRGVLLKVEGAFHSAAMAPAVGRVEQVLGDIDVRDPRVPLISGIDARARTRGEQVRRALIDGILSPVRWIDVQHALVADGVELLVEVGPGGILAGCAKRTVKQVPCVSVAGPEDLPEVQAAVEQLPDRRHADTSA